MLKQGRRFGVSKMHLHFKLAVASAGGHSKMVILLLLIHCLLLLELVFCCGFIMQHVRVFQAFLFCSHQNL